MTVNDPAALAWAIVAALLVLAVVLILVALYRMRLRRRRECEPLDDVPKPPPIPPPRMPQLPQPVRIAWLEEESRFSGGGVTALVFLILIDVLALLGMTVATTVFGQIIGLLVVVANTLIFGIGVIVGRRRRYVVYRDPAPAGRVEPRM